MLSCHLLQKFPRDKTEVACTRRHHRCSAAPSGSRRPYNFAQGLPYAPDMPAVQYASEIPDPSCLPAGPDKTFLSALAVQEGTSRGRSYLYWWHQHRRRAGGRNRLDAPLEATGSCLWGSRCGSGRKAAGRQRVGHCCWHPHAADVTSVPVLILPALKLQPESCTVQSLMGLQHQMDMQGCIPKAGNCGQKSYQTQSTL